MCGGPGVRGITRPWDPVCVHGSSCLKTGLTYPSCGARPAGGKVAVHVSPTDVTVVNVDNLRLVGSDVNPLL